MSKKIAEKVLKLAVEIQQIPAPTFNEKKRAVFIQSLFKKEGLADVEMDTINNVYGRLSGKKQRAPIIISAHTDTVFPSNTDLTIQRKNSKVFGPGIGDNSLGVAGLFGLIWMLREAEIEMAGDIWFVANVGEEGLGDLKGMRAVVERFGSDSNGYIILEGMGLGLIYHSALGVKRYRITAETDGGHSWTGYGNPSAIHELAELVTKIASLELPKDPRTSLNVGKIQGGTSINTIAAQATLELDLRSENADQLKKLYKKVEGMVKSANKKGVKMSCETISDRPMGKLDKDHELISAAHKALDKQGIKPRYIIGSTDANIPLSQGLPAICIGLTYGGRSHSIEEYIEISPIKTGLEQLFEITKSLQQN